MARPPESDRGVFVPAIMGAGLLFSVAVLVLDGVEQVLGRRHRGDVARVHACEVVSLTRGEPPESSSASTAVRSRRALMILAAICLGVAAYVAPGAWFNYLRPHGYVAEAAWVLALAMALAAIAGVVGVVLGMSALRPDRWSTPARRAVWAAERLTQRHPEQPRHEHGPFAMATLVVAVAAGLWTLAVAMNARVLQTWDVRWSDAISRWDRSGWGGWWSWAEPLGRTEVAVGFAVVMALLGWRLQRRLVLAHVGAVAVGVVVNVLVKTVVDRPSASYPSGHVIQAVILTMFATAWVAVVWRRVAATITVAVLGAVSVASCGLDRVSEAAHWPSDVVGGVLLGGAVASVGVLTSGPRRVVAPEHVWLRLPTAVLTRSRSLARALVLVAVVALAGLMITVGVPSNPEATSTTERLQQAIQLGLLGLVIVAWLVSWRWEAVGAAMLAVAGTAMAWFAALEYRPTVAIGIAVVFLAPAFLLWLSWQHGQSLRSLITLAVSTTVVVSAVWVGASTVHDRYFGPTHPASTTVLAPTGDVRWIWTGNLSPQGFTVVAALHDDGARAEFLVAPDLTFSDTVTRAASSRRDDHGVVGATFEGLTPGTRYFVATRVDGQLDLGRVAQVRTPGEGPQSFRVAFASCARTASNGSVFDAIRATDPLLYVVLGDAHYGDVASDDPDRLLEVWERTLTAPAQQALYQQVPVAYVWDDHDYGGNDSDASSAAKPMALEVYRDIVPHAPLPRSDDIGQSFVIGRVRFVLTDTRSHRRAADDGSGTLLGAAQEAWLIDQANAARQAGQLLVWVSPTPWIGRASPGSDTWAGFADERRRVADALVAAGVDDVLMLAGDAHMVAIDDGTNSGYATGGGGGFPVAHGSALDRHGSVKGGPYSQGTFPGGGQFGVLDIVDDGGSTVTVSVSGRNWRGDTLVALDVPFTVSPSG